VLVAGKGPGEDVRMAPPLVQPSPPGKEDQGRRETEKGKGGRNRDESERQGWQRAELEPILRSRRAYSEARTRCAMSMQIFWKTKKNVFTFLKLTAEWMDGRQLSARHRSLVMSVMERGHAEAKKNFEFS
jgi:hypothetical protein